MPSEQVAERAESGKSRGIVKWLVMALVFVAAFVVLKFVLGVAFAILKWAIIGAIALAVTVFVMKKLPGR